MTQVDEGGRGFGFLSRPAVWGGGAALMLLPVMAIRAASDAPSDPGDYLFLLVLLVTLGAAWEAASRVAARKAYRAAAGFATAAAIASLWINLAVGIIGSEDNPANWIFAAAPGVALVGALAARLRPAGMARAMLAAAFAQGLVCVIAFVAGLGFTGPITVFFAGMWLLSAGLFHTAGHERTRALQGLR